MADSQPIATDFETKYDSEEEFEKMIDNLSEHDRMNLRMERSLRDYLKTQQQQQQNQQHQQQNQN